jgi:hypothetical protein
MQRALQEGKWAHTIQRDAAAINQIRHAIGQSGDWDFVRESDGIRTNSRREGDSTISIRIEGVVQSPLLQLLVILHEIDLYPQWYPQLIGAEQLAQLSTFRKIVRFRFNAPWPLDPRPFHPHPHSHVVPFSLTCCPAEMLLHMHLAQTYLMKITRSWSPCAMQQQHRSIKVCRRTMSAQAFVSLPQRGMTSEPHCMSVAIT